MIYKQIYDSQDFYGGIKTVLLVHSIDEYCIFSRASYKKAGVELPDNIKGNKVNWDEAAAPFADLIIAVNSKSNNITKKLMALPGIKAHKKKVVSISIPEGESPSYIESARVLNDELTKHFA